MSPSIHTLTFTGSDDIDGGAVALQFQSTRPLAYTAGQHALWHIPGGGIAPYTFASAPEEDRITLATHPGSHSRIKRALAGLIPGDRVRLAGPLSRFTLDNVGSDVVMLAQGIGITPFRAMLTHTALTQGHTATTLIHVAPDGHPYRADTEAAAARACYPSGREEFAGALAAAIATHPDSTFMIAGTPAFVTATTAALVDAGIRPGRILRDSFSGWSGPRPSPVVSAMVAAR